MESTRVGTRLFFSEPETEQRDTTQSAAVSAAFHLGVILLIVLLTQSGILVDTGDQGVGTGIGAGLAGGGGGGGREETVSLLIPAPEPVVEEAAELTVPEVEEVIPEASVEVLPEPQIELALADTLPKAPAAMLPATLTGGHGTGRGSGEASGTGPGSGGGSGGGEGGGIGSGVGPGTGRGRVMTPSPEVLLLPPEAPRGVRGKTVVVRLAVDSTGIVQDADIIPPTGDRKFDAALKRVALGWRFKAARDAANRPVAVLFDVTFTF